MSSASLVIVRAASHLVAVLLAAIVGLALAAPPSVAATGSGSAFVGRSGATLTLNAQPWRFVGFNDYQLTSLPGSAFSCGRAVDQATLGAILADAKKAGATAIRTWFYQSYYDTNAVGQTTAPSWTAFDRVVNAAAAAGLKVIPVLVNEWQDCEPRSVNKNLGFFQGAYRQPGYGYPLSFRSYAATVAAHYANNPTIAFWQIGNELESNTPSGCDGAAESQGASALRTFADDVTSSIKAVDPNHLVSLGTMGSGQCGLSAGDYQYVHAGAVDLCEYHDYGDVTQAMPSDGYNRLAERIGQCRALGKPLFVGEAGIVADVGRAGQSTGTIDANSLQLRAQYFSAKMQAAFTNGLAGYLLWDKQQDASNSAYNLNNGRYSVGPSSLFPDPTNDVTASIASSLGSAAPPPARFGFEDGGLDGWNVAWSPANLTLANSTAQAWTGSHALAARLGGGVGYPALRTYSTTGAAPGSTIAYHVYLPAGAPAGLQAEAYVSNASWQQTFGPPANLSAGWNSLSWTVPAGVATPFQAIGIQINNGPGWSGTVYVDDVSW
jgi:mannan endo-1,4-beta-mannosidase